MRSVISRAVRPYTALHAGNYREWIPYHDNGASGDTPVGYFGAITPVAFSGTPDDLYTNPIDGVTFPGDGEWTYEDGLAAITEAAASLGHLYIGCEFYFATNPSPTEEVVFALGISSDSTLGNFELKLHTGGYLLGTLRLTGKGSNDFPTLSLGTIDATTRYALGFHFNWDSMKLQTFTNGQSNGGGDDMTGGTAIVADTIVTGARLASGPTYTRVANAYGSGMRVGNLVIAAFADADNLPAAALEIAQAREPGPALATLV